MKSTRSRCPTLAIWVSIDAEFNGESDGIDSRPDWVFPGERTALKRGRVFSLNLDVWGRKRGEFKNIFMPKGQESESKYGKIIAGILGQKLAELQGI